MTGRRGEGPVVGRFWSGAVALALLLSGCASSVADPALLARDLDRAAAVAEAAGIWEEERAYVDAARGLLEAWSRGESLSSEAFAAARDLAPAFRAALLRRGLDPVEAEVAVQLVGGVLDRLESSL